MVFPCPWQNKLTEKWVNQWQYHQLEHLKGACAYQGKQIHYFSSKESLESMIWQQLLFINHSIVWYSNDPYLSVIDTIEGQYSHNQLIGIFSIATTLLHIPKFTASLYVLMMKTVAFSWRTGAPCP